MGHRDRLRATIGVVALAILVLPMPAAAEETLGRDAGLGAVSAICTVVYLPIKLAYAAGGAGVSLLVYIWSAGDGDTALQVLRTTAGGDYSITREHLRGLSVVRFTGN